MCHFPLSAIVHGEIVVRTAPQVGLRLMAGSALAGTDVDGGSIVWGASGHQEPDYRPQKGDSIISSSSLHPLRFLATHRVVRGATLTGHHDPNEIHAGSAVHVDPVDHPGEGITHATEIHFVSILA